jgi:hypothetical protein
VQLEVEEALRKSKYEPWVYAALKDYNPYEPASNTEIANALGVDEASVRRGLKKSERLRREVSAIVLDLARALDDAGL